MTMNSSDAGLVAGHLAGDPSALGGIYDRYADSLHDTAAAMLNDRSEAADVLHDVILIAAERMGQLRDPDRLKPWLFAILRNEVYRRSKKRRRTIATDFSGSDDGHDLVDDRTTEVGETVAEDAAGEDLAELVRGAARGLDERDQLVLELSVRQGLGGQDLADALGVSANQSYTLVHRMRERVERSLAAYVVAKAGRNDCSDLDTLLGTWDGEFTVLIRKRVSRHVDKCDVCDSRRRRVAPLAMFGAAPVYAAPAALRDQILGRRTAGRSTADAVSVQRPGRIPPGRARGTTSRGLGRANGRCVDRPRGLGAEFHVAELDRRRRGPDPRRRGRTRGDDDGVRRRPRQCHRRHPAPVPTAPTRVAEAAPPTPAGSTPVATSATGSGSRCDEGRARPDTTDDHRSAGAGTSRHPGHDSRSVGADPDADLRPLRPPQHRRHPRQPTTARPPRRRPPRHRGPGQLSVSGGSIDLGSSATSGSVTVTNTGDLPLDFTVVGNPAPFSVSPSSGTLAGGASAAITASINRSGLSEGSAPSASVQVFGAGSTFNVNLSASGPEDPPVFRNPSVSGFCSAAVEISATVSIADASGVGSATLSVSGPGGQSGSTSLASGSNGWFGNVSVNYEVNNPTSASGSWSWTITASDTRGNPASTSGTVSITC